MALVTPTKSFLAGLLLLIPVHLAPRLTGAPYGISGHLHRSASPRERSWSSVLSTAGLLVGGLAIGWLLPSPGGLASEVGKTNRQWLRWIGSGLLVGAGSRLANGCTSGHMLSGLTRLSPRSLVATLLFFLGGGLTASLSPDLSSLPASPSLIWDWSVGPRGWLLTSNALVSAIGAYLPLKLELAESKLSSFFLSTSFAFSLALSGMLSTSTILSFLTPFTGGQQWNASLLFLALAIPLSVAQYSGPKPARDQEWTEPKLWVGAALFGVGWGLGGVCPGPGVVNFGQAIALDQGVKWWAGWVGASVVGGQIVQGLWA